MRTRISCYKRSDWSDHVRQTNQIARLIAGKRRAWKSKNSHTCTGSDPCIHLFNSRPPHHVFCGTARCMQALLEIQTAPLYDVTGSASSRPSILRLATMLSITCRHSFAPIRFRLVDCKVPPCKWRHRVTDRSGNPLMTTPVKTLIAKFLYYRSWLCVEKYFFQGFLKVRLSLKPTNR